MNRIISIAAFLLFCACLFLFLMRTLTPREEITLDQTNKTLVVKRDVKIKKAADPTWHKMDASTIIEKGDIVETAEGASVDIIIGAGADKAVRIEEKTRVKFEGINPASLDLPNGKILVKLKKLEPKSSFVVKTPTAICGARGTGWLEEAGPDRTSVSVFESDIFVRELDRTGRPRFGTHIADEGTERVIAKDERISQARPISEKDLVMWEHWNKNIVFLGEGKILINDFDKKENYNNLDGDFGSWNVFYSDPNQYCRDELTDSERRGDKGYCLKLSYDVDAPFSAYNGFFTKLMDIDISGYKYLVFYIKGDRTAGYTTEVNIELKNETQIGRATVGGITDQWKKVVIPLDDFAGIGDFRKMKELVIVFSDINVTVKEGVIYIDDIYFSKTESAD